MLDYHLKSQFHIYNPNTPTRYPQSNVGFLSTIDIMLRNTNQLISPIISHDNQLTADHCFVTFSINGDRQTLSFWIKKINWELSQNKISQMIYSTNINLENPTKQDGSTNFCNK